MRFVLDASITISWCFENQSGPDTEAILERLNASDEATVPFIWAAEVANVLVISERRHSLTPAQTSEFLEQLAVLPIQVDSAGTALWFGRILSTARENRLTTYDAAYLELALRDKLPLATLDRDLRRAALASGVRLI